MKSEQPKGWIIDTKHAGIAGTYGLLKSIQSWRTREHAAVETDLVLAHIDGDYRSGEQMVRPNDQAEHTDTRHGVDHPDRAKHGLTRKGGDHVADQTKPFLPYRIEVLASRRVPAANTGSIPMVYRW